MKHFFTFLSMLFSLLFTASLFAQTMEVKTAYNFPVFSEDSVLSGLKGIRNVQYHPDPLGNGVAAFAATNYYEDGVVSVFKNAGDNALELVYTTPPFDSLGGNSSPRYVVWGDLDNDGIIELIFHSNRNGIIIFEWDGVPGSWNFGDAPAKIIGSPDIPTGADGTTEYIDTVQDIDGDGQNELIVSINSSPNENDRHYIFSILGVYSTGDPGFSAVVKEAEFNKASLPFSKYGGGTPWLGVAADLDGQGNKEIILHNWNYGNVTPVRIPGTDTYQLADTLSEKFFYYSTPQPHDNVCYMGAFSFDIDEDGRDEVYLPYYYNDNRPYPGIVGMVHYEAGSDLSMIDSSNVALFDISSVNNGQNIFGYGYGDYDKDGKLNLYFSGGYGALISTMEFQGGDKTNQANWTLERLYEGESDIYKKFIIKDSLGTADTTKTIDDSFVSKFAARHTDFDKDGMEDMILSFQALLDSIDVGKLSWNSETNSYDQSAYKILNPKRWSIRMIEATVTGFESRDLKIITPSDYVLKQNYPNPFNPTTHIEFYVPVRKQISLTIYNALGQKVRTLLNNEMVEQGNHIKSWDSKNEAGMKVASGMYIYELRYGNFSQQKRMTLLK